MRGRVCPECRRRTVIYVHGSKLSWCTNPECKYEATHSSYEEHMKEYPKTAPNSKDVFERVPNLVGFSLLKGADFTEETLATGLHAIAVEERIEQGHIGRHMAPPFGELPEESQDVYRVIARFIMKCFVSKG